MAQFKPLFAVACALTVVAPASAQTDPSTYGTAMVQTGQAVTMAHANGQAGRKGSTRTEAAAASRAARTCANLPRVRVRLGADNPSVQGLARACRRGGYL